MPGMVQLPSGQTMKIFNDTESKCCAGINTGLNAGSKHAPKVAEQAIRIFHDNGKEISVPIELISNYFSLFKNDNGDENKKMRPFGFHEWLNAVSQHDPEQALVAAEVYLNYVNQSKQHMYDHKKNLTQLMTRLFVEAEEREESDCGAMLQRVVALQDILLSMGVKGIADWLKAAERP
ncbi:Uncharacterised protein [Serratia proteamaculans]|nr:Uncharacterised protein [Serratia proteamaculans]